MHYSVSCTQYSVNCKNLLCQLYALLYKRITPKIDLLNKMRAHLPIRERELFYNALIKPIIMYGSMVWTSYSYNDLKRILRLEKRAARIILGVYSRLRTVENFVKLKWLPLYDDANIDKCVLLCKALQGESPMYINDLLITNKSVHGGETRKWPT